ncbi:MAG TPA: AMP-binding protein [Crocinitomicaceae bacterium]|nr:AMP-binding protein [Crocinitomicaceae bacterium]
METSNNFNIAELFFETCQKFPEKLAIIEENRTITFQQLEDEVKNTVAYFQKKGIKKGDRILVFVGMSTDLYRIVLAIFSIGAVAVFVDEWVSIKRLSLCCKVAKCKAIIAPLSYRIVGFFISEIRKINVFLSHQKQLKNTNPISIEKTHLSDSALITFTTGSTGIPKAADRSHEFLKAQFDALRPLLQGQVSMTMLPVVLLLNLGSGVTSVIVKTKNFDASKVLSQLQKHKVESIVASPYYLLELANVTINETTFLHQIISGGAPIFSADVQKILSAFTNANFTIVYGSTEAEPIAHCNANEVVKNKNEYGLLIGKPDKTVTVKIIATEYHVAETSEVELQKYELLSGQIGEIIVSGNAVNKTYIDNPKAVAENKIKTEKTVWHRTGDSGYLDENGHLFLTGRVAQIIRHKGKTHYPFVVENQLKNIKGVIVGTLLLLNNKLILTLCTNHFFTENSLTDFEYDEIRYIKSFPFDPRHRSKIDYQRLMNLVCK